MGVGELCLFVVWMMGKGCCGLVGCCCFDCLLVMFDVDGGRFFMVVFLVVICCYDGDGFF